MLFYNALSFYDLVVGQVWGALPRISTVIVDGGVAWYVWVMGLLALLIAIALEGGYGQYTALHCAALTAASEEETIASDLATKSYTVGGERTTGDELFLDLAPSFRRAIPESGLESILYQRFARYNKAHPDEPLSGEYANTLARVEASRVLDDWFTLGLLARETQQSPGQPSPSGLYQSVHALPAVYSVYSLSPLGIRVLQHLRKPAIQSGKSAQSRLSARISHVSPSSGARRNATTAEEGNGGPVGL